MVGRIQQAVREDLRMPEAVILEFSGVGAENYHAVNAVLGIDYAAGTGDWPDGLLSHTGATTAGGGLVVFEVWDSQASQEAFMSSRLGPALGQTEMPAPSRLEWLSVEGHHVS
jgi:hypothetical protein